MQTQSFFLKVVWFTCQGHFPGALFVPCTTLAVTRVALDIPHFGCTIACGAWATTSTSKCLKLFFHVDHVDVDNVNDVDHVDDVVDDVGYADDFDHVDDVDVNDVDVNDGDVDVDDVNDVDVEC